MLGLLIDQWDRSLRFASERLKLALEFVQVNAVLLEQGVDRVLDGLPLAQVANWLSLLAAFDVIFLAIAYMTFEYVVEG